MNLGAKGHRLATRDQRQHAIEVVHHGEMKGALAGEETARLDRTVTHATDVPQRTAPAHLALQLAELAVEQQDVPHHQVFGMGVGQGGERFGLGQ